MKKQIISLPEISNQTYAQDLHGLLVDIDKKTKREVVIDASKVKQVSTAVLQILVSALQTFDKSNKKISIKSASSDFQQACFSFGNAEHWNR